MKANARNLKGGRHCITLHPTPKGYGEGHQNALTLSIVPQGSQGSQGSQQVKERNLEVVVVSS